MDRGTVGSDLSEIRRRLDAIDESLLEALARRHEVEREVAALKIDGALPLRDLVRERAQLAHLEELAHAQGLDGYFVTRLFRQILEQSVRYQQELLTDARTPERTSQHAVTVAYQGTDGSYSKMAAEKHFGPRGAALTANGYDTFADILEAVRKGDADYAMLPIENTTAGSINDAYDLLAHTNLHVVGEEVLRVKHCLVALPGTEREAIRRVYSHPQGLAQCAAFIRALGDCHAEAFTDTAMAVIKVRDEGDRSQAAIASEQAADLYGLDIVERDVADQKHNYTRFMVISRDPIAYDAKLSCKTSLIFATAHKEGALLQCLDVLAQRGLNLTKLESRPRAGSPWEYLFYVDFEGNRAVPIVQQALDELIAHTKFLKVLGSYPARTTRAGLPAEPQQPRRSEPAHASTVATVATPRCIVTVGAHTLDGSRPLLLGGPVAFGSRDHIVACARAARRAGVDVLRGGYRTTPSAPGAFAGIGVSGLAELHEVAQGIGLELATTISRADEVAAVARHVHLLEVPSAALGDGALLDQLGRVDRPVLLWRDATLTTEAWLHAAARVRDGGNQQVVLGVASGRGRIDLCAIAEARDAGTPVVAMAGAIGSTPGGERVVAAICDASLTLGASGLAVDFDVDDAGPLQRLGEHLSRTTG